MKKLVIIGAGSSGFTRGLLRDILSVEKLRDLDIVFMDIDPHTLDISTKLCQRDIDYNKLDIKIKSTTDKREALKDADYIINTARIGGLEAFRKDIEVPLRYGVDQCVGDTLGPGGIFYGQRGIPATLEFCKDIREVSKPGALMLSYANPNAMITWACNKYGGVKTIGLCHGVQHGHGQIAGILGYPVKDLDIVCAGINHQTWYVSVKYKGEELTPNLYEKLIQDRDFCEQEKCRADVMKNFGYYSTESNGHLSEYLMWYRKTPADVARWRSDKDWVGGETGGYLRVCTEGLIRREKQWESSSPYTYAEKNRSVEHCSYILDALENGVKYRGHVNYYNGDCITNLPADCIIEAPCHFDKNGFKYEKVGNLPDGCAAVCSQSIFVQRLSVNAAACGDINLLRQAMLMDPLTGAKLNTPLILQLTDEMLIEEAKWLPQYAAEIERAKARIEESKRAGTYINVNENTDIIKYVTGKKSLVKMWFIEALKKIQYRLTR